MALPQNLHHHPHLYHFLPLVCPPHLLMSLLSHQEFGQLVLIGRHHHLSLDLSLLQFNLENRQLFDLKLLHFVPLFIHLIVLIDPPFPHHQRRCQLHQSHPDQPYHQQPSELVLGHYYLESPNPQLIDCQPMIFMGMVQRPIAVKLRLLKLVN